jgi:hypothetical protein
LRWELCKVWKCGVDDEIFAGINSAQWSWYANMIILDKENQNKKEISLVEYLASFSNYEAVKKIQDARDADDGHSFASDQEFESQVKKGLYKDSEYLDAVRAVKENTNLNNNEGRAPDRNKMNAFDRFRAPRDLAALRDIIEDKE